MSGQSVTFKPQDIQQVNGVTFRLEDMQPPPKPVAPPPDLRGPMDRLAQGFAEMVLPSTTPGDYVKGPLFAAQNPLEALKLLMEAIGGAHADQAQKTKAATQDAMQAKTGWERALHTARVIGHGGATLMPVIGPAAANAGETLAEGDIFGGLGKTAGILTPMAVKNARVPEVPGVRDAIAGARTGVADMLEAGATRRFVDVNAPKTGANKVRFGNMAEDVAWKILRDPELGALSREGLQNKVEARLTDATQKLDEAANARLSARTFDVRPIVADLMQRRKRLTAETVEASKPKQKATERTSPIVDERGKAITVTEKTAEPVGRDVVPGPNAARVAQIDQAIAELQKLGPSARYESIRRIREAYDGPAQTVYNPSMTADFLKAQGGKLGAADVTGVLREHLAKFDPETAAANADYSLYKKAADVMEAARETERVRPNMFRKTMGRVVGATTGGSTAGTPGIVAGVLTADFLDTIARSGVTTKIQTARLMTTLADALRANRTTQVQSLLKQLERIRAAAGTTSVATGRTQAASSR